MSKLIGRLVFFAGILLQTSILQIQRPSAGIQTETSRPLKMTCASSEEKGAYTCSDITLPNDSENVKLSTNIVQDDTQFFISCNYSRISHQDTHHLGVLRAILDCRKVWENQCFLTLLNHSIHCTAHNKSGKVIQTTTTNKRDQGNVFNQSAFTTAGTTLSNRGGHEKTNRESSSSLKPTTIAQRTRTENEGTAHNKSGKVIQTTTTNTRDQGTGNNHSEKSPRIKAINTGDFGKYIPELSSSPKPTTIAQPTQTEHTDNGDRLRTLVGGIVAGFLGGVLITMVTVVVCWKCRRRRSAAQKYLGLKSARRQCTSTSETSGETSTGRSQPVTRSQPSHTKKNRSVAKPKEELVPTNTEYTYIAINGDEPVVTYHPSTGNAEPQNKEDQQDTYNKLGDHSEAKTNESKTYDRIGAAENENLSSDYFALDDDLESQNTYNKLRAKSGPSQQGGPSDTDTYNRIGDTENADLASDYFILEDDLEGQNTYNKLRVQPYPPQQDPDTYNRIGDTENADLSSYYFVIEDDLKDQNTYNKRRSLSDPRHAPNTYNTYNGTGHTRKGTVGQPMPTTEL